MQTFSSTLDFYIGDTSGKLSDEINRRQSACPIRKIYRKITWLVLHSRYNDGLFSLSTEKSKMEDRELGYLFLNVFFNVIKIGFLLVILKSCFQCCCQEQRTQVPAQIVTVPATPMREITTKQTTAPDPSSPPPPYSDVAGEYYVWFTAHLHIVNITCV